jgi:hypothetical protein
MEKKIENKKESKVVKNKESSIKLNINYLDFIKKVESENLLSKSKELLIEDYLEEVKLKSYRNISRVDKRSKREELRSLLIKELKERKMELSKYIEVSEKVVEKLSKKELNYISI